MLQRGRKEREAPRFWTPDTTTLANAAVKTFAGGGPRQRIYASQNFAWLLFGRRRQTDVADPSPLVALRRLARWAMPQYEEIVGARYPMADLLPTR
eukprot:6655806-Alexandrium_andersonii.AAC.1